MIHSTLSRSKRLPRAKKNMFPEIWIPEQWIDNSLAHSSSLNHPLTHQSWTFWSIGKHLKKYFLGRSPLFHANYFALSLTTTTIIFTLTVGDLRTTRVNAERASQQAWGQSTRYFSTLVLEYLFCSTRRYPVLVLLKSTCTRTCTPVLIKIKVLLTSTYEYFTSTSHLKLIQNSSQTTPKSLLQDMEHSVNDSFIIRLAIILKNGLINTLKLFQK